MRPDDYIAPPCIALRDRLPRPYDPEGRQALQDCDEQDRCWFSCCLSEGKWLLLDRTYALNGPFLTHWIPWWALPNAGGEAGR